MCVYQIGLPYLKFIKELKYQMVLRVYFLTELI